MRNCPSHNILCSCMFAGNATESIENVSCICMFAGNAAESMENVAIRETAKGTMDTIENSVVVQLVQWAFGMVVWWKRCKAVNTVEVYQKRVKWNLVGADLQEIEERC